MIFDRNQEIFESDKQRYFWNLGCNLIPLDISLTNITDEGFKECCIQLYQCLFDIYCDTFCNAELYSQYNSYNTNCDFFIEKMRGIIDFGALLLDDYSLALNVMRNTKIHKKVSEDAQQFKILERLGVYIEIRDSSIVISSRKYPKALVAIYEMFHEKAACLKYDYQRAIAVSRCDFRIFTKRFAPGFDDLLRPLSDIQRKCYLDLHNHALSKKIRPERRSYVDIQSYTYKDNGLLSIGQGVVTIRLADGIRDYPCKNNNELSSFLNEISNHEHAEELRTFLMKNIKHCNWCRKGLRGSPCCGVWWELFGNRRKLCHSGSIIAGKVNSQDVDLLKDLIDIRVKVIDKVSGDGSLTQMCRGTVL